MRISRVLEELDRTGSTVFTAALWTLRGIPARGCSIFIMIREPDGADDKDRCHGHLSGTEGQNKLLQRAPYAGSDRPLGPYNQAVKEMIAERLEGGWNSRGLFMDLDNFKINDHRYLGHIKGFAVRGGESLRKH